MIESDVGLIQLPQLWPVARCGERSFEKPLHGDLPCIEMAPQDGQPRSTHQIVQTVLGQCPSVRRIAHALKPIELLGLAGRGRRIDQYDASFWAADPCHF